MRTQTTCGPAWGRSRKPPEIGILGEDDSMRALGMMHDRKIVCFVETETFDVLGLITACFKPLGQNNGHVLVQQELHSAAAMTR